MRAALVMRPAVRARRGSWRTGSCDPLTEGSRSTKSLLEPRVVAYCSEVVVRPRLLLEWREQLGGAPEATERLLVDLACERGKARVVVIEAGVVGKTLEATAHGGERIGIALLAVGGQRLLVNRPRFTPIECLVRLAG